MGDKLTMSRKERQRKVILEQLESGHISRRDARKRLSLSERQLKRIIKRYRDNGDTGLVHKSRGRPPNNTTVATQRQEVLALYQDIYGGFGPTLASEKLAERDGITVHPETLRLWLKAAGLWQPHRRRKTYRTRRARRPRYGELLQLDGSIHAWLPHSEKKQCLMNMVDDATGKTLALLDYGETTRAALSLLKWWIMEAGIPLAIYVDLKSLYVSPKDRREANDSEEELVEPEWLTYFSKACKQLGVAIIKAYSAQAKGRVERNHAVYQDRFVKELKLQNIDTIEGANQLLSGGFINQLNEKFAKAAQSEEDAHVPLYGSDLDQILCWEYTRQVKNDWTIQFERQCYQIEKSKSVLVQAKQKILVRRHLDQSLSLWYRGQRLSFHPIKARSKTEKKAAVKQGYDKVSRFHPARRNQHKTPWGNYNPEWLNPTPRTNNEGLRPTEY